MSTYREEDRHQLEEKTIFYFNIGTNSSTSFSSEIQQKMTNVQESPIPFYTRYNIRMSYTN